MKRILISFMTIAVVSALIGGGVYAYFSDTETSAGNTFTAGTLDLQVDGENPWTSTAITSADNMEPGVPVTPVDITCENVGSLTGDLYMRITGVTDTGGTQTYACGAPISGNVSSEPECAAEILAGARVDDISTQIDLSCEVDGTPVAGLDGVALSTAAGTWVLIKDNLLADIITLSIGGTLSDTAANEYQGDRSTFTIELYLAQAGQTPS
jgi:spore coat-associated protein N